MPIPRITAPSAMVFRHRSSRSHLTRRQSRCVAFVEPQQGCAIRSTVWLDVLGAVLTAIALLSLGVGGYLLAVLLERWRGQSTSLSLAISTLLCATAQGVFWAVWLGAVGFLRLELALGCQIAPHLRALARGEARAGRSVFTGPGNAPRSQRLVPPAPGFDAHRRQCGRSGADPGDSPTAIVLGQLGVPPTPFRIVATVPRSIASVRAVSNELSGFNPANGSLWLWWWLAPSHSEIYANWAFVPQWILLALATGGVARELGALRSWPYASVVVALLPVILRFATTQYVDIFLTATWLSALFYLIRWIRDPHPASALLAGLGLGLALGSKLLGLPYCVALGLGALILARSQWRKRAASSRARPVCDQRRGRVLLPAQFLDRSRVPVSIAFAPRIGSNRLRPHLGEPDRHGTARRLQFPVFVRNGVSATRVIEAFLGTPYPWSQEMGAGPAFFPLVAAALALPWFARTQRRSIWFCVSQLVVFLIVWMVVPTFDREQPVCKHTLHHGCLGDSGRARVCFSRSASASGSLDRRNRPRLVGTGHSLHSYLRDPGDSTDRFCPHARGFDLFAFEPSLETLRDDTRGN